MREPRGANTRSRQILARFFQLSKQEEESMQALVVRSLKYQEEVCHGCKKDLGTHRTVTMDSKGNVVRFASECICFEVWAKHNVSSFVRRAS